MLNFISCGWEKKKQKKTKKNNSRAKLYKTGHVKKQNETKEKQTNKQTNKQTKTKQNKKGKKKNFSSFIRKK